MSGFAAPGATSASGVTLEVDGAVLGGWTGVRVMRDLRDVSGSFHLGYYDQARIDGALGASGPGVELARLKAGMKAAVKHHGVTVLQGHLDQVDVGWSGGRIEASVSGRDAAADLVDCAAAPDGPLEYRNQTALQIATALAKPFGIKVRADVDVGEAFKVFGLNADETAMLAIERAARQRALLVVSDGVGGLLLTRGGSSRAPAPLAIGGNVLAVRYHSSWTERFSDYFVKGQTVSRSYRSSTTCAVVPGVNPATAPVAPPAEYTTDIEARAVKMTGHATDPEITRWRPTVRGVRTQSGSSSVQAQAEWALRVARGMSEQAYYTVLGWTANGTLWRPNALVRVDDPYAGIERDMLIASVHYEISNRGVLAHLGVAGRTAFDRIDESAGGRRHIFRRTSHAFGPTRQG